MWVRPALLVLLAATAGLYLVDLAASGWANSFYSAAVQAGTKSWKAFFFGSFDSSNFITVDKPPASLWVMGLSARAFGLSSWSILAPQALEGVASVALLYVTVRRQFSPAAGLLAGAVLALTPVAALMFRFNNPDALLTLLLIGSAYAVTRALETASGRWLVLAGVLLGLGFLTKMLQAFLVVPGFAFVYLLAAPASLRRRLAQLLWSGVAIVVSAGWWVAIVALWPAASRPYIGGSQNNSILNLIFGYNGFGRITGDETGSVVGGRVFGTGGGPQHGGIWGLTGATRLFGSEMGTQISWLLPAALMALAAVLVASARARRTDRLRGAALLWGSWLLGTGAVFSYMQGIIHPYYNVALAPPIGALVGIGACLAWSHRGSRMALAVFGAAVVGTAVWGLVLLDRTPRWHPWLRYAVLSVGLGVSVLLVVHAIVRVRSVWMGRALFAVAFLAALVAPAAFAIETSSTAHTGSLPTAGPAGGSGFGGPGAFRFGAGGSPPRFPQGGSRRSGGGFNLSGGGSGQGTFGGGTSNSGQGPAQNGFGVGGAAPGRGFNPGTQGGGFGPGGGGGFGGGLGGLLNSGAPSSALVSALRKNASRYRWVAATVGANSAAGVQLGASEPVMAIGGFNGTDPTPTLDQFEIDAALGEIHYYLGGGSGRGGLGSSSSSSAISAWIADTFTSTTIGGVTVYDLTDPLKP
jgi:4-amino-4-deoxy-L-arabinose transferase-like glycosyltransferase